MGQSGLERQGYTRWLPPEKTSSPSRALVLGGGGATGIAWLGGLIGRLREHGIDVAEADTVIGTSAGSVVGAQMRLETPQDEAVERITRGEPLRNLGRVGRGEMVSLLRGAFHPDRPAGRALIGTISTSARTGSEAEFIDLVAGEIGPDWPDRPLLVTAVDTETGTSVAFSNDCGLPLDRCVAASCSVPGVFPPVTVGDRTYMDGGTRSVANADLAQGHERVLILAPLALMVGGRNSPAGQARHLRGARTLVIAPDSDTRKVIGLKFLDMRRTQPAFDAGRSQADRVLKRVEHLWNG